MMNICKVSLAQLKLLRNVRNTTQSLEVVRVDVENNLLLIKGAVPGATGSSVIIKPAIKMRGN